MRIGFSVEGSTDRAFICGLKDRWCPAAILEEGAFRGTTALSRRRECKRICEEFLLKGVDVMIFLTDANDGPWREVRDEERAKFPADHLFQCVHGVPDRNIECWICAAPEWLAEQLGVDASPFRDADPKGAFESAMHITRDDKKEGRIAELIAIAPMGSWLERSRSFEDFYDSLRAFSLRLGCEIENLRDD
jgi:hypothetical protein